MPMIEFFVPGTPRPQGSKSISRTGHLYESNKGLKAWRKTVEAHATLWRVKQRRWKPLDGPLWVAFDFRLPRPKRPKDSRPIGPPDLSKLVRAVEDGLKVGGIIKDDARIVRFDGAHVSEYYCTRKTWAPPAHAGCLVRLGVMEE